MARKVPVKAIPSKYKKMGKHIVVDTGITDSKGGKVYRIVGKMWGR